MEVFLYIADCSDFGERAFQFEHRFEPVRGEFEIVIEENQIVTSGVTRRFVVGCAKTEISFVSKDSLGSFELLQPIGSF